MTNGLFADAAAALRDVGSLLEMGAPNPDALEPLADSARKRILDIRRTVDPSNILAELLSAAAWDLGLLTTSGRSRAINAAVNAATELATDFPEFSAASFARDIAELPVLNNQHFAAIAIRLDKLAERLSISPSAEAATPAESNKSKQKRRKTTTSRGPRTIDRDLKWVQEYDIGLETGAWDSIAGFAIEKKVARDTMSKALDRGRAALRARESVKRSR